MTPAMEILAERLRQNSVPDYAIAGIVSNAAYESEGDPAAVGDKGTSIGLLQWHGDRAHALMDFADAQGKSAQDPAVQADYLLKEMGADPRTIERMADAGNAYGSAMVFQKYFIRPKTVLAERGETAVVVEDWLRQLPRPQQQAAASAPPPSPGLVPGAGGLPGTARSVQERTLGPLDPYAGPMIPLGIMARDAVTSPSSLSPAERAAQPGPPLMELPAGGEPQQPPPVLPVPRPNLPVGGPEGTPGLTEIPPGSGPPVAGGVSVPMPPAAATPSLFGGGPVPRPPLAGLDAAMALPAVTDKQGMIDTMMNMAQMRPPLPLEHLASVPRRVDAYLGHAEAQAAVRHGGFDKALQGEHGDVVQGFLTDAGRVAKRAMRATGFAPTLPSRQVYGDSPGVSRHERALLDTEISRQFIGLVGKTAATTPGFEAMDRKDKKALLAELHRQAVNSALAPNVRARISGTKQRRQVS